ncbi:MAG: peptidylprolyl isomerase [Myxococcales bacterium]|nr:peptidylprolyl isomerase [Myxococcales bacterium]
MRRVLLLSLTLVACGRRGTSGAPAPAASSAPVASVTPFDPKPALVGADLRREPLVPVAMSVSTDVRARRAATRALAQIGDATVVERLGKALSDEDPEVVAWAGYGLGVPCDADPDLPRDVRTKLVAALSARALSLEGQKLDGATLDPFVGIAFGLGRCGGIEASRALMRWLETGSVARAEAAAFALGAIAQHDRGLEDDVASALVGAARGGKRPALDAALFAFGRGDWSGRPPTPGLAEVARLRIAAGPSPLRPLAIRALGRAAGAKVEDLRGLVSDAATPTVDVIEGLRALHRLGEAGDAAIAAFATRAAPIDPASTAALLKPHFGPLRVALELLSDRAADKNPTVQSSLRAFLPAGLPAIPAGTAAPLARRLATVRCLAASALHAGHPGDPEVVRCAAHDASLPAPLRAELDRLRDRARLATLDRGEITGDKRDLLAKLANDGPPSQRELALELFAHHPETEEAPDVLERALGAKALGVVAAAAQAIADRPGLAGKPTPKKDVEEGPKDPKEPKDAKSKDAGVDASPEPPPPTKADPRVLVALDGALSRPFEEADAEVALSLAGAVGALRHAPGRGFLTRLCGDRSPALRRAARNASMALDGQKAAPTCAAVGATTTASPLLDGKLEKHTVELVTEIGTLTLALDPKFAPVAATRIAELAGGGFYDGTVVHRVVPGFVVQLGDPGGDGYGGAHSALRCETAPVPFAKGGIGIALAGRDTGSSQFFVMLGRAPHLEGSYAWIGEASGPWELVAEGDVVVTARVK